MNIRASIFFPFIRRNFFYLLSILFERSISFLLVPVYTHILSPEMYGVFGIILAFIALTTFLYTLGMENGIMRYGGEIENKNLLHSTVFWTMTGLATLFSVCIFIFSSQISQWLLETNEYAYLIKLSAFILFSDSVSRFFLYGILGEERSKLYVSIGCLRGGLILITNFVFVIILKYQLHGIFISQLVTNVIVNLFLFILLIKNIQFVFDRKVCFRLMRYGLPIMFMSLSITMLHFFDRFLIQIFLGKEATGLYAVSYRLGFIMNLFITAFNMSSVPFISRYGKNPKVYAQLMHYLFFISFSSFIFLSLFIRHIVKIKVFGYTIIQEVYWTQLQIVPLILLAYVFYGIYSAFSLPHYHQEKTSILSISTFAALMINTIANLFLIPEFGLLGAAISTLAAFIFMTIFIFLRTKSQFTISYDWGFVIPFFSMGLIGLSCFYLFNPTGLWFHLIFYLVFQYLFFISFRKKAQKVKL